MNTLRGFLLLGTVLAISFSNAAAQFEPGMVVSGFRVPDYDENGQLQTQIFGEKATAVSQTVVDIQNLRIETFEEGKVDMRVVASDCRLNQETGIATSKHDVRITRANIVISGTGFQWESNPTRFEIHRDARVVIRNRGERKPLLEKQKP